MKKRITFIVAILLVVCSFAVTTYQLNSSSSGIDYEINTPTPDNNLAIGTPTPAPTHTPEPITTEAPTSPTATPDVEITYDDIFADAELGMVPDLVYAPIDLTQFPGITLVSTDESVLTVDENGQIQGVAVGETTVSAVSTDGDIIDEIKVIVYPYKLYDNGVGYSIGYYFGKDENLTIPSHIAGKPITIITRAVFQHHTELKTIVVPDTVVEMRQYTFQGCTSLYYVKLSENLKTIGNCSFYGCTSLVDITIPDSVTTLGTLMFQNCYSLKTVDLGNGVTSVGPYAFDGCTALTKVTIGKSLGAGSLSDIFYSAAFAFPIYLEEIEISSNNPNICSENGVVYNIWKSKLLFYPYGKTDTTFTVPASVSTIDKYAISNNPYLTSIELPSSCNQINENGIFGCTALKSVTAKGIITLGKNIFAGCSELSSVAFNSKLTTIGENCFSGCDKLSKISLPKSLTSIGELSFDGLNSTITIEYAGTDLDWQKIKGFNYLSGFNVTYTGGILATATPTLAPTPTPTATPTTSPQATPTPESTSTPTPEPVITPEPVVTPEPDNTPEPDITLDAEPTTDIDVTTTPEE